MSKPAAIMASLVDVRNIAAHRCVRLEIHVPVEQASLVMAAFGWPTAADPVPVAIARLVEPEAASERAKAEKPRQKWESLPLSQQAAIRCGEESFWRFLAETHSLSVIGTSDEAADYVRIACGVKSRAEIGKTEASAKAWRDLDGEFQYWQRVYA